MARRTLLDPTRVCRHTALFAFVALAACGGGSDTSNSASDGTGGSSQAGSSGANSGNAGSSNAGAAGASASAGSAGSSAAGQAGSTTGGTGGSAAAGGSTGGSSAAGQGGSTAGSGGSAAGGQGGSAATSAGGSGQGANAGAGGSAAGAGGSTAGAAGSAASSGQGGSAGQAGSAAQGGSAGQSGTAGSGGTAGSPACADPFVLCGVDCVDVNNDVNNCGSCGATCSNVNAQASCNLGNCEVTCNQGFNDCDNEPSNGCETTGYCVCTPGTTRACAAVAGLKYSDAAVGSSEYFALSICKLGTETCNIDGTGYDPCVGAVGPAANESCATAADDNCNGQANESSPNSNCACLPGDQQACYTGPAGTQNVGVCHGGTATCLADGSAFGPCVGQVVPAQEACDGTQSDEDCNGQINEGGLGCVCVPGSVATCYTGPAGTLGIGLCSSGQKTCNADGLGYGPCVGEVTPTTETCSAGVMLDEDCDGLTNEVDANSVGCVCLAGTTTSCYDGPGGLNSTQLTAPYTMCAAGTATCLTDGTGWGACQGQILPGTEICDVDAFDEDCDGQRNEAGSGCECTAGQTQQCWEGPANAVFGGTSICQKGTRTCQASGFWGACTGQVLPGVEPSGTCTANIDEDCDGDALDNGAIDVDGDGWSPCTGDCCEYSWQCSLPALVNPGAYDVTGNGVDDDCDGTLDNAVTLCDSGLASNSGNALDYAKAIDLCQFTTENATGVNKKWGVISAQLLRADGTGTPATNSRSIRPGFGTNILPQKGSRLAVLSTGVAADSNDTNPAYASFQIGQDMGTSSGVPADWLAANGGVIPNAPGCPPPGDNTANDPVMLKLRIRVPTNAKSFSFNSYFFSAEYPEWTCSPFNDFFVALLDSSFAGQPANPADKNLAFYDPPPAGAPYYPVGVNLASGNTGLFRVCKNGQIGCDYTPGTITTCTSNTELNGTGFDILNPSGGYCGTNNQLGGATGYLQSAGNIVGGETIEMRFAIWDTSDHVWDSVVLLDNWLWSLTASQPGTVIGGQ